MSFYEIADPTAYPSSAPPGPVLITVPITSLVDFYTEVIVRIRIFEGLLAPWSGKLLDTQSKIVGLYPRIRTDVQFMHSSTVVDSQERRDIEVSVWQDSTKFEEKSWDDIFFVISVDVPEEPPEGDEEVAMSFEVSQPVASPYRAPPGSVLITIPVISNIAGMATIKLSIYEGSFWPGHGTWLASYEDTFYFSAGVTRQIEFTHNSVEGSIDRRDVRVVISKDSATLFDKEWDDVYYVTEPAPPPEEIVDFGLSKPFAYPYSAPPGPVLITCPVTSRSSITVTAKVRCIIYEGSFFPTHGTKLWEGIKMITISPNETKNVEFMRTSRLETIDRRDIEVEVWVEGQLIIEDEWDDVYYVTEPVEPPPPPDDDEEPPPEEVKEIPWVPIALIGAGVAIIAVSQKKKT